MYVYIYTHTYRHVQNAEAAAAASAASAPRFGSPLRLHSVLSNVQNGTRSNAACMLVRC